MVPVDLTLAGVTKAEGAKLFKRDGGWKAWDELKAVYRSETLNARPLTLINWYEARLVFEAWNFQSLANGKERVWQRGEINSELRGLAANGPTYYPTIMEVGPICHMICD